jgi:Cu(I)/Ag(I) efflux system membrane fusion protein
MSKNATVAVGVLVVAAAAGFAGNWWGAHHAASGSPTASAMDAPPAAPAPKERKLRFYRNPMGLADTSPTPKKDPMGMDYIAVYEGEEEETAANANQNPEVGRAHRGCRTARARQNRARLRPH